MTGESVPPSGAACAQEAAPSRHGNASGRRVANLLAAPASLRATLRAQARAGDLSRLRFEVYGDYVAAPEVVIVYETLTPELMRYVEDAYAGGALLMLDLPSSGPELGARAPAALLERAAALADVVTTDTEERGAELARRLPLRRVAVVPDTPWPLPPRALAACDPPGKPSLLWFGTSREFAAFESLLPWLERLRDVEVRARVIDEPDAPRLDLAGQRARHPDIDFDAIEVDQLGDVLLRSHLALLPLECGAAPAPAFPAWKRSTCTLWGLTCLQQVSGDRDVRALEPGTSCFTSPEELEHQIEKLRSAEQRRESLHTVRGPLWQRVAPLRVAELFRDLLATAIRDYAADATPPVPAPTPRCAGTEAPPRTASVPTGWLTHVPYRECRVAPGTFARSLGEDAAAIALDTLEERLAARAGAAHALAVQSARAALILALRARGVAAGDEVLMPSLAPRSIPLAALALEAAPVLADVDPATLALDPEQVVALLRARTRALVVADYEGMPAPLAALRDLAELYGVACISFAAEGLGGVRGETPVGAEPLCAVGLDCMGFGESTSLGFVTCADAATYADLRRLRDGPPGVLAAELPRAPVLPYVQLGLAALDQLDAQRDHHAAMVGQYARLLDAAPSGVASLVRAEPPARTGPWTCLVRTPFRSALQEELGAWKIATRLPDPLNHHDPALADARRGELRQSEHVHAQLLALPVARGLSARQRLQIDRALRSFLDRFAA